MKTTKNISQSIRSINKSKFYIITNDKKIKKDFGFPFSAGVVLLQKNQIFLFQENHSKKQKVLGKIFCFDGNLIFDIPFPASPYPSHVSIAFNWCSFYQDNIFINFITDTSGYHDFGLTFNIDTHKFHDIHSTR